MEQIKKLLASEQIKYLFFGVCTTAVNYGVFWALTRALGLGAALWANVAAFIAATAFAFLTNKAFVFAQTSWKPAVLLREAAGFAGARLFSFAIEQAGLALSLRCLPLDAVRLCGVDGVMLVKIALSFLAVLLNYVFAKFLIFRK